VGFSVQVSQEPEGKAFLVTVKVQLTNAESSRLFLAGDVLLSWPPGAHPTTRGADSTWREADPPAPPVSPSTSLSAGSGSAPVPFERSSMFISEVARLPEGLRLRYRQEGHALQVAGLLKRQLLGAGIREEE
jgi:hypothetical protein